MTGCSADATPMHTRFAVQSTCEPLLTTSLTEGAVVVARRASRYRCVVMGNSVCSEM